MSNEKYTDEEIQWAIQELKKKHPERADRKHAIKLLDIMKGFSSMVVKRIKEDKKSGKLKKKLQN